MKRRRAEKDEQRKSISSICALLGKHVPCHEVCNTFFFHKGPLVLSPKNDKIFTKTFKKAEADGAVLDGPGKCSKRRANEHSVKQLIERYHPAVSLYMAERKTPHR